MIENPFLGPPARPSGVKMPHWEAASPECKYTSWSMVAKSYELGPWYTVLNGDLMVILWWFYGDLMVINVNPGLINHDKPRLRLFHWGNIIVKYQMK